MSTEEYIVNFNDLMDSHNIIRMRDKIFFYTLYQNGNVSQEGSCIINDILFSSRIGAPVFYCYDIKTETFFLVEQKDVDFVLAVY